MSGMYDDIINMPHHVSDKRPPMARADRAAQFAPFAALTGYGAAVAETGRLTETKAVLDEYEIASLNEKLTVINDSLSERPTVTITVFRPDERKSGGAYVPVTGVVKKIDEYERVVIMESGERLPIDDIAGLERE